MITHNHKFIALVGWISLIVLLGLSIHYYLERVALLDSAYQIFLMINDNRVDVMTNRWPIVIFRWLPYLALQLKASLSQILILQSISYPIYQGIIFFLLLHILKNPKYALQWIICITVMVSETFYWCPSDLQQGLGLVLLLFAIFESKKPDSNTLRFGILAFLMIVILFVHPLLIFPFLFIAAYQYLDHLENKIHYVYLSVAFILAWIIKSKWITNWYDIAKSEEFAQHFQTYKSALWRIPTHMAFLTELVYKYHFLVLILVVSIYLLIQKKLWMKLILMGASCFIYIMIIHLGNPNPDFPFYREAAYIPLIVFASIPLLNLIATHQKYIRLCFILIVVCSMIRICIVANEYQARVNWIQNIALESDCDKRVVDSKNLPMDLIKMDWGIPYESLLISHIRLQDNRTIYATTSEESIDQILEKENQFLHRFKEMQVNELSPIYFSLGNADYCR